MSIHPRYVPLQTFKGAFVRNVGSRGTEENQIDCPHAVAVHGDVLWIAENGRSRVQAINKDTGETLAIMGTEGRNEGQLYHPSGIAVAPLAGEVSVR